MDHPTPLDTLVELPPLVVRDKSAGVRFRLAATARSTSILVIQVPAEPSTSRTWRVKTAIPGTGIPASDRHGAILSTRRNRAVAITS